MMKRIILVTVLAATAFLPILAQELPDYVPVADQPKASIDTIYAEDRIEATAAQPDYNFSLNIIKRDEPYRLIVAPTILSSFTYASYISKPVLKDKYPLGVGAMFNLRFGRRNESARGGTGKFAVDLGLFYIYRSFETDVYYLSQHHKDNMHLHTLQLPLALQFYAWKGICIETGVTYDRVLKATPRYLMINENDKLDLSAMKSSDIKIIAGLGMDCGSIYFGMRYLFSTSGLAENLDTRINELQAFIRYNFRILNK